MTLFYNEGKDGIAYFAGKYDESNSTFYFHEGRFIKGESIITLLMDCYQATDVVKPKDRDWKFTDQNCTIRFKKDSDSKFEQWIYKYLTETPDLLDKYYSGQITIAHNASVFSMLNDPSITGTMKDTVLSSVIRLTPVLEPSKLVNVNIESFVNVAKTNKYGNYQKTSRAEEAEEIYQWVISKLKPYSDGVTNITELGFAVNAMKRELGDDMTKDALNILYLCLEK